MTKTDKLISLLKGSNDNNNTVLHCDKLLLLVELTFLNSRSY